MIVWHGNGLAGLGVMIMWPASAIALMTLAGNFLHPGTSDSFELVQITHPAIVLLPIVGLVASTVHLWLWGRSINADGIEHAIYGIPVQFLGLAPALGAIFLCGYVLMSSPLERARDDYVRVCKDRIMDLTYSQCECVGQNYAEMMDPEVFTRFVHASKRSGRTPILDRFMETELGSFSSAAQSRFHAAVDHVNSTCELAD
jgi:hypothetical protein